jgi:ribosomal protein S27AE
MNGITSIPNPEGTKRDCTACGAPTVVVSTATGNERVHCGTYEGRCHITTTARGRTR